MDETRALDFILQLAPAPTPFWAIICTIATAFATSILALMAWRQYRYHIRPTLTIELATENGTSFFKVTNVGRGPADMLMLKCDRPDLSDLPLWRAHLGPNVSINYPAAGWMRVFKHEHETYSKALAQWHRNGEHGGKPANPPVVRCAITYSDTRLWRGTNFIQYFYVNLKFLNAVPLQCVAGTRIDFDTAFQIKS